MEFSNENHSDSQLLPPVYFASFADRRFKKSLERISNEAHAFRFFKEVFCWNEDDLEDAFWHQHSSFILKSPRGFGYYIWKPQVVLQALERMPEGAVLVFADAGCQLNVEGLDRLKEYVRMAIGHASGIVGFNTTFPMEEWTKMDTLHGLQVTSEERRQPQHLGGVHIMHNRPSVQAFVRSWKTYCEQYALLDDSPSFAPNARGFRDHRHDQSIFSILFLRQGGLSLPDETWWEPHWESRKNYPIHAKRIRE
jgi:hypothetical protein